MSKLPERQTKAINPNRLALARKRSQLNKKKLAELVGKTTRSITAWESEEFNASEKTVDALANALGYPREYFFGDDIEEISPDSVSFRSFTKLRAGKRDSAIAVGSFGLHLDNWITSKFDLPNPDLLDLRGELPEVAAATLRQYWGMGERPVKNVVFLLEAKGVRIFSLADDCSDVDAFSFWKQSTPYVFLNNKKTAERSRFDCAHELGHLILHKHGAPSGQEAERQADEFASAFLMPASSIRSTKFVVSVNHLVRMKRKWNVSLWALIVRLYKLSIISEWNYRSLCIETQRRFGKSEPNGIERERSQVFDKVFKTLWSEGITLERVAKELAIPVSEIKGLLSGLMLNNESTERLERPKLHLIVS